MLFLFSATDAFGIHYLIKATDLRAAIQKVLDHYNSVPVHQVDHWVAGAKPDGTPRLTITCKSDMYAGPYEYTWKHIVDDFTII